MVGLTRKSPHIADGHPMCSRDVLCQNTFCNFSKSFWRKRIILLFFDYKNNLFGFHEYLPDTFSYNSKIRRCG